MNNLNPKYQKIIDAAAAALPEHEAVNIRSKVELYNEHANIREEFFNRPAEVTAEKQIQQLAKKYHYSVSAIEKIIYST